MKKGNGKKRSPTKADKVVGQWIRVFREDRGFTQTELAQEVAVTFQQIQKYENGKNRVSAGALFTISKALGRPIEAFFKGA